MLRFCQGSKDPFYFLLLKYIQSPDSTDIKQEIVFAVDSSLSIPNMSTFCIPQQNFDPSTEGEIRFIFYLKSNDLYPTYGYVVQLIRNQKRTIYCLLSPYYNPQKLFGIITQYLMKPLQEKIPFLSQNSKPDFNSPQNNMPSEKELILSGTGQMISLLNPELIGNLIVYLALDYHIIVTSSNFEILSLFAFSILSAIHPLVWPGVFIPVLTESMIDTILAPFPYIIGMHSSIFERSQDPDVEQHISINIDEKTMSFYPNAIKMPFRIKKAIDSFKKKVTQLTPDKYYYFSQYSHELILECISYAVGKPADKPNKLYKQWNILKGCHNLEPFSQMVCQSQLVLNLMREIENASESLVYRDYFEADQSEKYELLPPKIDKKTKQTKTKFGTANNSKTPTLTNAEPHEPVNAKLKQAASTRNFDESDKSTQKLVPASKSYSTPSINAGSNAQPSNFSSIMQIESLAALFASKYENGGCIDSRFKKSTFKTNAGIETPENLSFAKKIKLYNSGFNDNDNDNA